VDGQDTWLQLARRINRPDPELIHIHWPHSHYADQVRGNLAFLGIPDPPLHPVDLHYDQYGFRNDRDLERADVVVIGDSFVEAALVTTQQSVTGQLAALLGRTVANRGQSAYGLRQELAVLERYGLPLSPGLVVWMLFGGNDLRDVRATDWARAHFEELQQPRPLRKRLFLRNALLFLAERVGWMDEFHGRERARARSASWLLPDGTKRVVYFGQPTPPWDEREWRVATSTLQKAQEETREAGADFLLVFIPRKFTVYRGLLVDPGADVARWKDVKLGPALGSFARQAGIPFLDTTPALRAALRRGEEVYFPDDVHWTAAGHRIAAEQIAARLGSLQRGSSGDAPPEIARGGAQK